MQRERKINCLIVLSFFDSFFQSNNNGNNAWRDPYGTSTTKNAQESNEWNGVPNENGQQDESNTWASGNQRYQYRQGSGNYRGSAAKSS